VSATTHVLTASCRNNLDKLVQECQTIRDFAAAADDEGDNQNSKMHEVFVII